MTTTERRAYVADIDASIAVLQELHDYLRQNVSEIGESIGRLASIRHEVMDGVFADEARARVAS